MCIKAGVCGAWCGAGLRRKDEKMAIRFCLRELPGGSDPGSERKCAKVVLQGRCGSADFLQRMRDRGCRLVPAEIAGVLALAAETAAEGCREGMSVEIPHLGTAIPSVTGSTDSRTRGFGGLRIGLRFRFNADLLKRVRQSEKPVLVQRPESGPRIDRVVGLPDGVLRRGALATICGRALRFDPARADEGVWFVRYTGERTELFRAAEVLENRPARILCGVPKDLPPGGALSVLLRTRGRGKRLREAVCQVEIDDPGKEVIG